MSLKCKLKEHVLNLVHDVWFNQQLVELKVEEGL
jgi:hypothetical protein